MKRTHVAEGNLAGKPIIITGYIRQWPRAIFNLRDGRKHLESVRTLLDGKAGVYILYRDHVPHYVGQAKNSLWKRIVGHATKQNWKYYNFWNYFSAIIVTDRAYTDVIEGAIIAALGPGAANSATPRMKRIQLPRDAARQLSKLKQHPIP